MLQTLLAHKMILLTQLLLQEKTISSNFQSLNCVLRALDTGQGSSTDTRYTQEGGEVSVPPKYWLGHRTVEGKEPPPPNHHRHRHRHRHRSHHHHHHRQEPCNIGSDGSKS